MSEQEVIVGIDLGTTNSEVAAYVGDTVIVLGPEDEKLLPSCVGLTPDNELLVGEAARNQQKAYPERTIRSVKRLMGTDSTVLLGDQKFSPPEVSGLILRELVRRASEELGQPVEKAVITVPAYFSDAQRQATREAGQLAGLEVVRILNEPTAASLAYGYGGDDKDTLLVYDLGGGTFDVSIVTIEGDVTEVLASHGNTRLGGDDFDNLLVEYFCNHLKEEHGVDLRNEGPLVQSRLRWAAEEAKKALSFEPVVQVREPDLTVHMGKPIHLELELERDDYERMIKPLFEETLESVSNALSDANMNPDDLDGLLLVGGSTRTPLVTQVLKDRTRLSPRGEVHPDLCVALGAGVLASRLGGKDISQVLVDVSPYSFGISYLGMLHGRDYLHCYKPIIQRNTPLPVTRTEMYYTAHPYQTEGAIQVYQGDNPDAMKNIRVGQFMFEGLTPQYEPNEVLCRMNLDLDGILHVTAIEKRTSLSKHIRIEHALQPKTEEELDEGRARLAELLPGTQSASGEPLPAYAEVVEPDPFAGASETVETAQGNGNGDEFAARIEAANNLLARSRGLLDSMHDEDREDAVDLHERIQGAIDNQDSGDLAEATNALKELLFFVEGK